MFIQYIMETTSNNYSPIFIRLPKSGHKCLYTGLSRSSLYNLITPSEANGYAPPVVSHVIRKRGCTRGIRVINAESLKVYIESCAVDCGTTQTEEKDAA